MTRKTDKTKKRPQPIADDKLDSATGGLLPAVQASRGAAAPVSFPGFTGGVRVASADLD